MQGPYCILAIPFKFIIRRLSHHSQLWSPSTDSVAQWFRRYLKGYGVAFNSDNVINNYATDQQATKWGGGSAYEAVLL